jgi:hypothetical protein
VGLGAEEELNVLLGSVQDRWELRHIESVYMCVGVGVFGWMRRSVVAMIFSSQKMIAKRVRRKRGGTKEWR